MTNIILLIMRVGSIINGDIMKKNIKIHLVYRNAETDKLGYYGMGTDDNKPISITEFIELVKQNCANGTPITILEFKTE